MVEGLFIIALTSILDPLLLTSVLGLGEVSKVFLLVNLKGF